MATKEQLQDFFEFASMRIQSGETALSLDELYFVWRSRNPSSAELSESLAAVRAAYADLEAGDSGRPAREALRETCLDLGLVVE